MLVTLCIPDEGPSRKDAPVIGDLLGVSLARGVLFSCLVESKACRSVGFWRVLRPFWGQSRSQIRWGLQLWRGWPFPSRKRFGEKDRLTESWGMFRAFREVSVGGGFRGWLYLTFFW